MTTPASAARSAGESDLDRLFETLSAELADGEFVFATVDPQNPPLSLDPVMRFREREGMTLILPRAQAEAHDIACAFPCRMITLNVHSALEAVGFMARIAQALAAEGIPCNPVAGFYHDHLFVPTGREDDALRVLARLAGTGRGA